MRQFEIKWCPLDGGIVKVALYTCVTIADAFDEFVKGHEGRPLPTSIMITSEDEVCDERFRTEP